ncbi:hypothetical protein BV25DRAFT_1706617 [Artomyces pyxidatus]|uniref:Uncharacterized protein n=1 Tax=Artomyces pyxidatus TaxID=48021 RepID=A0ACB8TAW4_9AGAM|nr:hypothetical protein BV25DRAFT_1706617 [Artomyces pyxidatus]
MLQQRARAPHPQLEPADPALNRGRLVPHPARACRTRACMCARSACEPCGSRTSLRKHATPPSAYLDGHNDGGGLGESSPLTSEYSACVETKDALRGLACCNASWSHRKKHRPPFLPPFRRLLMSGREHAHQDACRRSRVCEACQRRCDLGSLLRE